MSHETHEKAAARANLCRYLAACYYEPGPEFAEERVFDSMLEAAAQIDCGLAAQVRQLGKEYLSAAQDSLLLDYTRLFMGPSHIVAQPYASAWLEGEHSLMQDSTMAVEALYEEAGFEVDGGFRELPDHIACELEFLYLLIYREREACANRDFTTCADIASLRERFLTGHLGSWIAPFTDAVGRGAQSAFYRELAAVTNQFVKLEIGATSASDDGLMDSR